MNGVARSDKGERLCEHQIPCPDVRHIKGCVQCSGTVDRSNRPRAVCDVLDMRFELIDKLAHAGYKGAVDRSVQVRFFITGEAGRMQGNEIVCLVEITYK